MKKVLGLSLFIVFTTLLVLMPTLALACPPLDGFDIIPEETEFVSSEGTYNVEIKYSLECWCPAAFVKVFYVDHHKVVTEVFRGSEGYMRNLAGWNTLWDKPIPLPVPTKAGKYEVIGVAAAGHRDDNNAAPWSPVVDWRYGEVEPYLWDWYFGDFAWAGRKPEELSPTDYGKIDSFVITVTYKIEWLPPLAGRGARGPVFKSGSTVPIKFSLRKVDDTFICDPQIIVKVRDSVGGIVAKFTVGEGDDFIRCYPDEEYYIVNFHTEKGVTGVYIAEVWSACQSVLIGATKFILNI